MRNILVESAVTRPRHGAPQWPRPSAFRHGSRWRLLVCFYSKSLIKRGNHFSSFTELLKIVADNVIPVLELEYPERRTCTRKWNMYSTNERKITNLLLNELLYGTYCNVRIVSGEFERLIRLKWITTLTCAAKLRKNPWLLHFLFTKMLFYAFKHKSSCTTHVFSPTLLGIISRNWYNPVNFCPEDCFCRSHKFGLRAINAASPQKGCLGSKKPLFLPKKSSPSRVVQYFSTSEIAPRKQMSGCIISATETHLKYRLYKLQQICNDLSAMAETNAPEKMKSEELRSADVTVYQVSPEPGISALTGAGNYWQLVSKTFYRLDEYYTAIETSMKWTLCRDTRSLPKFNKI